MPAPIFPPHDVIVFGQDDCARISRDGCRVVDDRIRVFEVPAAYSVAGMMWTIPVLNVIGPGEPVTKEVTPIIAFRGRPLDRITLWCARIRRGATGTAPPGIRFDLRVGFNHITTLSASLNIVPTSYDDDADLLFAFSGLAATQWEIWAGTFDAGVGRPAVPIQMNFDVTIDHSGCCEPEIQNGPWVV